MNTLFRVTAMLEGGAGVALAAAPVQVVSLLFGVPLEAPAAQTVGRIAGAALMALGLACWLARNDSQSRAAAGLLAGLVLYNGAAAGLLVYAGLGLELVGIALWPGAVLHLGLLAWCIVCYSKAPAQVSDVRQQE